LGSNREGERTSVEGRGTERVGRGSNPWWSCLCACGEGREEGGGEWVSVMQTEGARMAKAQVVAWPTSSPKTSPGEVCGVRACFIACVALPAAPAGGCYKTTLCTRLGITHMRGGCWPRLSSTHKACGGRLLLFWCFNCPLTDQSFAQRQRPRARSRSLVDNIACWWGDG